MTSRSPSAETARFIATILSARQTSLAELPTTISALHNALNLLQGGVPAPSPNAVIEKPARQAKAVRVTVIQEEPRRRGRPRRLAAPTQTVEDVVAPEPAQPRLLRRAELVTPEHHHDLQPVARTTDGTLHGVVKWFDGRAGKGALRLTGISGDIALDASALARSGIKRLYKDQEIQAIVQESGGQIRLVSLSLPGRPAASAQAEGGDAATGPRRQPRTVMVEIKRDGGRQQAARSEAEQVFGNAKGNKINRPI
jgi:cold shock CspA family protein